MKINKILMPTDFSETANHALDQAIHLAVEHDAELVVLHARVMYEDDPSKIASKMLDIEEIEKKIKNEIQVKLQKYKNIRFKHSIVKGYSAPSAILGYLNDNPFDLVVIGTHGRTGIGHFLIGSVAEKIVRYAPCPVLTINRNFIFDRAFKRMLVPFDFSDHARLALETAISFTSSRNAELDLLYVVDKDVHPALYAWGMKSIFDVIPDIREKAKKRMDEVLSEIENSKKVKINKRVVEGIPSKEIAKFVNENDIDLIIMATHGLVGLDRFLLGSTTEKVIRSVDRPILSLKLKKLI